MQVSRIKEANHSYRKIFIDSKYRIRGSSNDFTVNIPEVLDHSHNMRFCLDDIALPRSWYNVGNTNNYVYVAWNSSGVFILRRVSLTPGDYDGATLATELQTRFNNELGLGNTFTVVFNRTIGRLQITNTTHQVWFPTDDELVVLGVGTNFGIAGEGGLSITYNLKREFLNTANYVMGNLTSGKGYNNLTVFDPINLNWLDTVYVYCYDFGSHNTLNLRGEKIIVKGVKINEQSFSYIFDNANFNFDWLDCSHQSWSQLSFSLRDKNGNLVDLNNRDFSFSIVLQDLTI